MSDLAAPELPKEHDSLSMPLRGEHALAQLGPLLTPRQPHPYRRVFVTYGAGACDCNGGLVMRVGIDRHLAGHPDSRAELWEPSDPEVWSRLHDLLLPLPERCELAEDRPLPKRNREIVVPAIDVSDPGIVELLGLTVVRARATLGLDAADARSVAQALATLAENSRVHAVDSAIGPLAACALDIHSRELQVAVLDLGGERRSARLAGRGARVQPPAIGRAGVADRARRAPGRAGDAAFGGRASTCALGNWRAHTLRAWRGRTRHGRLLCRPAAMMDCAPLMQAIFRRIANLDSGDRI